MKKFFIGIDVSKKTFDAVAIKAEGLQELMERKHEKFQNNADGFKALLSWLTHISSDKQNEEILFKMPVWAPGYYIVVDFPKYLTDFTAEDETGKTLLWNVNGHYSIRGRWN